MSLIIAIEDCKIYMYIFEKMFFVAVPVIYFDCDFFATL